MGTGYYWVNDEHKLRIYIGRNVADMYDVDELGELFDKLTMMDDRDYIDYHKPLHEFSFNEFRLLLKHDKVYHSMSLFNMSKYDVYFLDRIFGKGEVISEYEEDRMEETEDYKTIGWDDRFGSE